MPALTTAQIHKLNRDPVSDPHLLLIEIEELHSGFVHRHCRNNEAVLSRVSDGSTQYSYEPATIEFSRIGHGEEIRGVSITVSNVDRNAGRALILSSEPVMVRMIVIDYASPDTALEDTLDLLGVASADISPQAIEARLESNLDFQLPWPPFRTTAQLFPGLFA